MDKKELLIFEHYANLIEYRNFDEFDIMGFLIFIREHIKHSPKKATYGMILDFSDLIAHRHRNKGRVMEAIQAAIDNGYALEEEKDDKTGITRHVVKGYNGMSKEDWTAEWERFAKDFGIKIDTQTLFEITMCIFSLCQYTEYDDSTCTKNRKGVVHKGKMLLGYDKDNCLDLITTEGDRKSLHVCFSKFGPYEIINPHRFSAGMIDVPVITERKDGKLRLVADGEYII